MKTKIEGLDELNSNFKTLNIGGKKAFIAGLNQTAVQILTEAKKNLSKNGSRVTGALFRSGKVNNAKYANNAEIESEIQFTGNSEDGYAYNVEFGRKPGKGLNEEGIKQLAQWVIKKGLLDTYSTKSRKRNRANGQDESIQEQARQVAIWISGRFKKRGMKGKPFLFPAFEDKKNNLHNNIRAKYQEFINKL